MTQVLRLRQGDCVEVIRELAAGSLGAIVVDPPYGLEFGGNEWDHLTDKRVSKAGAGFSKLPGSETMLPSYFGTQNLICRNCGGSQRGQDRKGFHRCRCDAPDFPNIRLDQARQMQRWHVRWLKEAFRALRPGGIIKAFSGSRTYHRLAAAMVEVGFEIINFEAWCYGSGFPKSMDLARAINKLQGYDPETEYEIRCYLREQRISLGLTKSEVDQRVFGGTTRYSWVEGRGGDRSDEVYLPTPEEWLKLKGVLQLDDRFDDYIQVAIPSREQRQRIDGGKADLVSSETTHWIFRVANEELVTNERRILNPNTDDAKRFIGYGTALKPAWEPFVVGLKRV